MTPTPKSPPPAESTTAAPSTLAVPLSSSGSAISFEALAATIRAQAEALQAHAAVRQPLSDDDWRSLTLSFSPPHFDMAQWPARPVLNELSGAMAVDHAYRALLGRAPDADGLASGEHMVAHGMHPLLFAGILLTSTEGRSRPRPVEGFGLYRKLAVFFKVLDRLPGPIRPYLVQPALKAARLAAAFHRRWDANNLTRWQLQSLRNTLASWQPVLERQAGQLGAAQQAVQDNQQGLDTLRQELTVARARLNALGHVGHATYMPSSSPVIGQNLGQNPGQGVSAIAKQEAHADGQLHAQAALASELDTYYLAFEDAHRASARDMRAGFQAYQPLLDSLKAKGLPDTPPDTQVLTQPTTQADGQPQTLSDQPMSALDLGCGRGEWLVFLAEQGFDARGIDASQAMVAHCQAQGLKVNECDLLQALQLQPDGSLNLITAFHVAEHLDFARLYSLVAQAWRVLKPGGALLLETPNPENPLVGSYTFYHDPTHRNPLTPSALEFLLGYHGFERLDVLRLNPYPESARVPGEDLLTERINGLLCGPQDFAVVGRRPGTGLGPESRKGPESPPSQISQPSMASSG